MRKTNAPTDPRRRTSLRVGNVDIHHSLCDFAIVDNGNHGAKRPTVAFATDRATRTFRGFGIGRSELEATMVCISDMARQSKSSDK
jgi:hypothetical protein